MNRPIENLRPARALLAAILLMATLTVPASAQWIVTDPATTLENSAIAALKTFILQTLGQQRERLQQMATRLSAFTSLNRYIAPDAPLWRIHDFESDAFLFAKGYHGALNFGDAAGVYFAEVALPRLAVAPALLDALPAASRDIVRRILSTLDAADASLVAGTHQTGTLRFNGRKELAAINALQSAVVDPSNEQSTTAVLDKISAATLLEVRQNQARLQLLTALAEQLVIENKRLRDAEATALNMQLGRFGKGASAAASVVDGAANDLASWRQP